MTSFALRPLLMLWLATATALAPALKAQEPSAAGVPEPQPVVETFKTYRLINSHTSETVWKGYLMVNFAHRFGGVLRDGPSELWGMDAFANVRLSATYGLTDDFSVGLGRSRFDKLYDFNIKYRALKQTPGAIPLTLTCYGSAAINSEVFDEAEAEVLDFSHRLSYAATMVLARKWSEAFSTQLSPTLVHRNLGRQLDDDNTVFALGTGLSYRISRSLGLKCEYLPRFSSDRFEDVVAVAVDITSSPSHSFQLQLSNTTTLVAQEYLTETTDSFWDGDLHIGFAVTRHLRL
jgi:hypothetical protein